MSVESGPATGRELVLGFRAPIALPFLLDSLAAHAVPGLERRAGPTYERVVSAPGGPGLLTLSDVAGEPVGRVFLTAAADLAWVEHRVRRLLDLDADPAAVDGALGADPRLAPLVAARPGLRAAGVLDGFEAAVRTVVGQQISVRGARTVLGRMVARYGRPVFDGGWFAFPTADALAAADPDTLPMPRARARSVLALATAFAAGGLRLDPGGEDPDALRDQLLAVPGIGPWTADYLIMRGGHPDILLASDLVVRRAADELGIELADGRPGWAPWRTYATHHLWAHRYAGIWAAAR